MNNILRLNDVIKRCGISRTTIYRMVNKGNFPAPVKLTSRSSGWICDEVSSWLDNRIAERDSNRIAKNEQGGV